MGQDQATARVGSFTPKDSLRQSVTQHSMGKSVMTTTFVSAGVVSSGVIVSSSDTLEVLSGATAQVTTVTAGGTFAVDLGGTDVTFTSSNSNTHDTISSGGIEIVSSGGLISGGLYVSSTGVSGGGFGEYSHVLSGGILDVSGRLRTASSLEAAVSRTSHLEALSRGA
jgi:autotransporter passenger strand-loop-strand repeat protein